MLRSHFEGGKQMSGEDIPYQLRPNKFIDRQMFMDLLSRLVVPRGPEKYVYVSMGGRHLVDHYAIYNKLGIQSLFSFDMSTNEVARQKFNRPTGKMICTAMNSADLPSEVDAILERFPSRQNLIVWLDYTTADRRAQFQDAVQTLVRLNHGDIFRITLNSSPHTLGGSPDWKQSGAAGPGEYRADRLRAQIFEFLPTEVTAISDTELPSVLARCFGLATDAATALQPTLRFIPVLITSYKDGARMLTITCAVSEVDNLEQFPARQFRHWKFACRGWNDILPIYAPVLSLKEQYRLDANLHRGAKRMLSALSFLLAKDETASLEAIESYRSFHRYYPTFRHIED
jgi:hypothetical protein